MAVTHRHPPAPAALLDLKSAVLTLTALTVRDADLGGLRADDDELVFAQVLEYAKRTALGPMRYGGTFTVRATIARFINAAEAAEVAVVQRGLSDAMLGKPLQVDMKGALTKRLDSIGADLRSLMRDKNVRHGGISREGHGHQIIEQAVVAPAAAGAARAGAAAARGD